MAAEFVQHGHLVSGCARSASTIQGLNQAYGSPHTFAVCNVADAAHVQRWSQQVLLDRPPPDLLINNAALINRNAPLWELAPDEFSEIVDVNIKGVFHAIHCFLPPMLTRKRGVIVNFSSGWGRVASADVAAYCATKWAIEGLTQSLAMDLPSTMAAVPLNPGIIHTEMLESCFGGSATSYPSPERWARRAVPFLLELGPSHNGQPLTAP